jgi:hypothetical protein
VHNEEEEMRIFHMKFLSFYEEDEKMEKNERA